eukprot:5897721-Pyramimonas_sp.AAC.1
MLGIPTANLPPSAWDEVRPARPACYVPVMLCGYAPAPAEPESTPTEPESTPTEPESTPTEPESTPMEPESTPAEPESTPAE